jgi:hypothetical protein
MGLKTSRRGHGTDDGMMVKSGTKKGFFFTVLALILLTFMMISVQMWAQEQAAREERQSERFRVDAIRAALSLADENTLAKFTNVSLTYSIHFLATSLTNTSCSVPFIPYNKTAAFPDGTAFVNQSLVELITRGTTHGGPASILYPFNCSGYSNVSFPTYDMIYTLNDYFNKTSSAAKMLGFNMTWGSPRNFTVNQSAVFSIYTTYSVDVNISDTSGFSQNKTLHIFSETDIQGILDPFISGMDRAHRGVNPAFTAKKQVFYVSNYDSRPTSQVKLVNTGSEGLGWFFGPATNLKHDDSA